MGFYSVLPSLGSSVLPISSWVVTLAQKRTPLPWKREQRKKNNRYLWGHDPPVKNLCRSSTHLDLYCSFFDFSFGWIFDWFHHLFYKFLKSIVFYRVFFRSPSGIVLASSTEFFFGITGPAALRSERLVEQAASGPQNLLRHLLRQLAGSGGLAGAALDDGHVDVLLCQPVRPWGSHLIFTIFPFSSFNYVIIFT